MVDNTRFPSPLCAERRITRISSSGRSEVTDVLLVEARYDLYCNAAKIATLHCSPRNLEDLAVGNLFARGLLPCMEALKSLTIDIKERKIETAVSSCTQDSLALQNDADDVKLLVRQVHGLQKLFDEHGKLHRKTGSAHSCALATTDEVLLFLEDIARHNALDKLVGAMLRGNVSPHGKIILFSSRLAGEMTAKAIGSGVKLLIAPGAPSLASVELADRHGITLLGFVRNDNINIYTHPYRVI